jgi:LysM repeat protein
VPVSPTSTQATTIPPVPQTDKTGSTLAPDGTWTVQANDTLSGIATKLGVSYTDLLAANPEIDPKKFLVIGQKLNVPTQSAVSAPSVNTPTQTQAPGQSTPTTTSGVQASGQTYTVVAGDYFIGIAKKLGVSLDSLLSVNNMSASSLITAGMKLKIPKGGTVPKATATTTAAKTTTTTVKK